MVAVFVLLVAVVVPASPGVPGAASAEAFCHGQGDPMMWSVGWAKETVRWNTTCDGLGDYYGKFIDGARDGSCVDYYWQDEPGGAWIWEGRNCSETKWKNFDYVDRDGFVSWKICKHNGGCAQVASNWGF